MPYTCTKTFDCVSTAHRNWRAKENPNRDSKKCSYIHGYTKTFTFVFGCQSLDEFEWVYDYGTTSSGEERTMTKLKKFIQEELDHGVTTDNQDPMLFKLVEMDELELIKLIVIPVEDGQSGSVEGLCRYLFNRFDPQLREETNDRCWIESVTISEHHKNSSTYTRENNDQQRTVISVDLSKNLDVSKIQESLNKYANTSFGKDFELFDLFDEYNHLSQEQFKTMNDRLDQKEKEDKESQNKKSEEPKKSFDSDILDKLLTKENLERGLRLLQFHPKYKVLATSLLVADDIKDAVLKNPKLLELLQKVMK